MKRQDESAGVAKDFEEEEEQDQRERKSTQTTSCGRAMEDVSRSTQTPRNNAVISVDVGVGVEEAMTEEGARVNPERSDSQMVDWSDKRTAIMTPPAQVMKKQKITDVSTLSTSTDVQKQPFAELDEEKVSEIFREVEEVCLELASVEVALRRCSQRSEFQCTSPRCKLPNQVVKQVFGEYRGLSQSKRALLTRARKLRRTIYSLTGDSPALTQQVRYLDFALSVTTTVPGVNDLEDDQLRRIFTEILRLSDNCPTSMMSLSRVCKRWGKLVRSADVWKALHLNKLANSVADHELLVLLGNDKAFSKVSSISLASCVQVTEKSLLPILRCCGANLTFLDISGCWLLTKRTLEIIVECCPKLNHLNMSRCSGIMLADALEIIEGSRLAKSLQRLGIGYMGGVCRRIPRSDFELIAAKTENFLVKHQHISVGSTQSFFRFCLRKLEDIPHNPDQSMCQAPFCSLGDGDDALSSLQLLQCGHVICLGCESLARGNVRTVHNHSRPMRNGPSQLRMSDFAENELNSTPADQECHIYPCPTCGNDMGPPSPCSTSFSIIL